MPPLCLGIWWGFPYLISCNLLASLQGRNALSPFFPEESGSLWEVREILKIRWCLQRRCRFKPKWLIPPWNFLQPRPVLLRDIRQPRGPGDTRDEGISCCLPIHLQAGMLEEKLCTERKPGRVMIIIMIVTFHEFLVSNMEKMVCRSHSPMSWLDYHLSFSLWQN